jgi:hypothetical protein
VALLPALPSLITPFPPVRCVLCRRQVLTHSAEADQADLHAMTRMIRGEVGIKKLLLVVEMARHAGKLTPESFRQSCLMCGVPTYRAGAGGGADDDSGLA